MTDNGDDPYQDAENCAVRILSRRDHARLELQRKLKKRDFSSEIIERVLVECERRGWVNDHAFATRQAEILGERGWGPLQIIKKLCDHGVAGAMARDVVAALEMDWVSICRSRMVLKFGEGAVLSHRDKAVRHLRGRGFTEATIRRVILDGA